MLPADVRILDAKDLFVSQASLTGESEPIEKIPMVNETRDAITDYTNIAFMGSNVLSGSASAVVVTVGDHTLFGSMAQKWRMKQWKQASAKESTRYRGC